MILALLAIGSARHPQVAVAVPGDIATHAGGGVGDGGGAANAAVSPHGVAADGAGNLYIADSTNCRVRRLTAGGAISTVVGDGICGFAGDGGSATTARLSFPQAVAVTPAGELYIADTDNCRIRKVDTVGTITTFAGNGVCLFAGEGIPATSGSLAYPRGVAFSTAGDVYIADTDNCRVRKVSGGTITTFAGTGACGYLGDGVPANTTGVTHVSGVWEDGLGNVYIADTDACRVRVVPPSGTISTVAGNGTCAYGGDGGLAYSTSVNKPRAITTDATGDLYIADSLNCRIRKVDYPFVTISTIAGTGECNYGGDAGPATSATLNQPRGVAVAGGDVYIGDSLNCRVRKVSGGGILTGAGTGWCQYGGDGGPATDAAISNPVGVAVDSAGAVYITDTANCRVRKVSSGGSITTFAGTGTCGYGGDGGLATSAQLDDPAGVAVDASGNAYIADAGSCRIRKVTSGVITTFAGDGMCAYGGDGGAAGSAQLSFPQGVAVAGSTVYIADTFNCRIRRVTGGTITTVAGDGTCTYDGDGGSPASASFSFPYGVAGETSGTIYIADTFNCRVRRVSGGTVQTLAGTGSCGFSGDGGSATAAMVNRPAGIAVAASGSLYVADADNCRLRLISATTILTTAGSGSCGFGGDGGVATAALLDHPSGVAVGVAGDVYVADAFNDRIRRISGGADGDGDGVADVTDNCAAVGNGPQTNTDRNFVSNAPVYATDDLTWIASDLAGDACDPDDDNDSRADASEPAGCNGSGALDPLVRDTDGDRFLDGPECILGTNPADPGSKPAITSCGPAGDADGDGISDRTEVCMYNSNPASINSDGDVCRDGKEVASVNTDTAVNAGDQLLLAQEIIRTPPPAKLVNFDMNKDGGVNSGDQLIQSAQIGPCP
jgi:hypothetical protein